MKLLGRDIPARELVQKLESRLRTRGLSAPPSEDLSWEGVEPRVDPLSFNLHALEENADATRGLPMQTHRGGVSGALVLAAKKAFRAGAQVFINEAMGRQRVFNAHVRDSYAQLSAEVIRLRDEVERLKTAKPVRAESATRTEAAEETAKPRRAETPAQSGKTTPPKGRAVRATSKRPAKK